MSSSGKCSRLITPRRVEFSSWTCSGTMAALWQRGLSRQSQMTVLRMIERGILAAQQVCKGTPWVIRKSDLQSPVVTRAALLDASGAVTANPDQDSLEFQ